MKAEYSLTSYNSTRYYRICPNTVIPIRQFNYQIGQYVGFGQDALTINYPNIKILCGNKGRVGKIENNCTFTGGTYQIEIHDLSIGSNTTDPISPENVQIQGFTFEQAKEANIIVYGSVKSDKEMEIVEYDNKYGSSLYIKDCVFMNNHVNTNIWLMDNVDSYLNVQRSVFMHNQLKEDDYYPHAGLISSSVGGTVVVKNSKFLNNQLEALLLQSAMRSIIYTVQDTDNGWHTNLRISGCEFKNNHGMTFSLALAGLWANETKSLYSDNNWQYDNTFVYGMNNECYGIAQLIQDDSYYDSYYYYYYYHDDAVCQELFQPTLHPIAGPIEYPRNVSSGYPIGAPSAYPSWFPTRVPSTLPSVYQTAMPSSSFSDELTKGPTRSPTISPTQDPTAYPTPLPIPDHPTAVPTRMPTRKPTEQLTVRLTGIPTDSPTKDPTASPTRSLVSDISTVEPTISPSISYTGPFYIQSQLSSQSQSYCIIPSNNALTAGSKLVTNTCEPWLTHQWEFDSEGKIHNAKKYDLCINMEGQYVSVENCVDNSVKQRWLYCMGRVLWYRNGKRGLGLVNTNNLKNSQVKLLKYTNQNKKEMWNFSYSVGIMPVLITNNVFMIKSGVVSSDPRGWCLYPTQYRLVSGTRISLAPCEPWKPYKWNMDKDGRIHADSKDSLCISRKGKRVLLSNCSMTNNMLWSYSVMDGKIVAHVNGRKQISVGDVKKNGSVWISGRMENGNEKQRWSLELLS